MNISFIRLLYLFLFYFTIFSNPLCAHLYNEAHFLNPPTEKTRPYNILFVGNSITFWSGGLPEALTDLTLSMKIKTNIQEHTEGGRFFFQHAENKNLETVLKIGLWDYVVLQGNTSEAIPTDPHFNTFSPSLRILHDKIKQHNHSCKIILFSTTPADKKKLALSSIIHENYTKIGMELNVVVAPVGLAWIKFSGLQDTDPSTNILFDDEKHPSVYGKMLNTYLFYGILFNKNPKEISIPTPQYKNKALDPKLIKSLKEIAFQTLVEQGLLRNDNSP